MQPTTVAEAVVTQSAPVISTDEPSTVLAQPNLTQRTSMVDRRHQSVPETRMLARTLATERQVQLRPETEPDYGWLAEALWHRIEQHKRYPSKARAQHWEGKVVLEVVIRDDGTIVSFHVAESSGHEDLDQNALQIVKQASPLLLKHPLGQTQVTILIPVTYKLSG
jgi:protein TonB